MNCRCGGCRLAVLLSLSSSPLPIKDIVIMQVVKSSSIAKVQVSISWVEEGEAVVQASELQSIWKPPLRFQVREQKIHKDPLTSSQILSQGFKFEKDAVEKEKEEVEVLKLKPPVASCCEQEAWSLSGLSEN